MKLKRASKIVTRSKIHLSKKESHREKNRWRFFSLCSPGFSLKKFKKADIPIYTVN